MSSGKAKLTPTPKLRMHATIPRLTDVGTKIPPYSAIILVPMKPSTAATLGSKYFKSFTALLKTLYKLRSPMMAKMLLLNTISGFSVTPNTAGMLSTANTTSLISTATMQRNRGVAIFLPRLCEHVLVSCSPEITSTQLNSNSNCNSNSPI